MRNLVLSVLIVTLSGAAVMAQLPAPAADTVAANRGRSIWQHQVWMLLRGHSL